MLEKGEVNTSAASSIFLCRVLSCLGGLSVPFGGWPEPDVRQHFLLMGGGRARLFDHEDQERGGDDQADDHEASRSRLASEEDAPELAIGLD